MYATAWVYVATIKDSLAFLEDLITTLTGVFAYIYIYIYIYLYIFG